MADRRITAVIEARDRATRVLSRVGKSLTGLGAIATAVGAVALGRTLVRGIDTAVAAAKKQQNAEVALANAIRNQGRAVSDTLPQLKRRASALQTLTGVGDESILQNQSLLVTYGLLGDELDRASRAALDLAASGVSQATAFDLIGKAAVGYTATLSRYGIIVDANLSSSEKFEAALEQLERRFGGRAADQLLTYEGRVEALAGRWSDFLETIGGVITKSPTLNRLIDEIANTILGLTNSITDLSGEEGVKATIRLLGVFAQTLVTIGTTALNASRAISLIPRAAAALANVLPAISTSAPGQTLGNQLGLDVDTGLQATLDAMQRDFNRAESIKDEIDALIQRALEGTGVGVSGGGDGGGGQDRTVSVISSPFITAEEALGRIIDVGMPAFREQLRAAGDEVERIGVTFDRTLREQGIDSAFALGDALTDAAFGADIEFDKFIRNLLKGLAAAIVRALILRAILSAIGGGGGAAAGAAVGGVGGSVGNTGIGAGLGLSKSAQASSIAASTAPLDVGGLVPKAAQAASTTITIQAMDSRDVRRFLEDNSESVGAALARAVDRRAF